MNILIVITMIVGASYSRSYERTEFSFYKDKGYDRIKAAQFHFRGPAGAPELPVEYITYITAPDSITDSVIIESSELVPYERFYNIYPYQPYPCDDGKFVEPEPKYYESDSPNPERIVNLGGFGVRLDIQDIWSGIF